MQRNLDIDSEIEAEYEGTHQFLKSTMSSEKYTCARRWIQRPQVKSQKSYEDENVGTLWTMFVVGSFKRTVVYN